MSSWIQNESSREMHYLDMSCLFETELPCYASCKFGIYIPLTIIVLLSFEVEVESRSFKLMDVVIFSNGDSYL